MRTVLDVKGNAIEEPTSDIRVAKKVAFKVHTFADKLKPDSPSGHLIEIAKGFCLSGVECLPARDARVCYALLRDLQKFQHAPAWRDKPPATVQTLPITRLNDALEGWIMSHFNEKSSGMMPHYALAAADLITKLIEGYSSDDPEPWEVRPLFGREWYFDLGTHFFDARFKKQFSEACQCEVVARVPNHVNLDYQGRTILEGGDDFVFKIRRCHLSNVINDWTFLKAVGQEAHRPRFDLTENFLLKGYILGINEEGQVVSEVDFHLPPHWVVAERYYDHEAHRMKDRPLPKLLQPDDPGTAGAPFLVQ